jgi:hypothetical protein
MKLTTRRLRALGEACAFILAGEADESHTDPEALEDASEWVTEELARRERRKESKEAKDTK